MKIMHIVGNRPQFIKMAPISWEMKKRGYKEIIIHTGQHFDANMSEVFFRELDIPVPDENLHISGGTHAEMTARIMMALEKPVETYKPDVVILYGDTNSTLAAALVVRKLGIPIVHVEAGPRTGSQNNPEEINRTIVDHISDILCAPNQSSKKNLDREGLDTKSYFTGDVMYDTFLNCCNKIDFEEFSRRLGIKDQKYILLTWHREENTSSKERMEWIVELITNVGKTIVFPIHPRTKNKLLEYGLLKQLEESDNVILIEPVGYLEMVSLLSHCELVLTDSGGLSKESFFANVRCLFMLNLEVWPELEKSGWIIHLKANIEENLQLIDSMIQKNSKIKEKPLFYGEGKTAKVILDIIEEKYL